MNKLLTIFFTLFILSACEKSINKAEEVVDDALVKSHDIVKEGGDAAKQSTRNIQMAVNMFGTLAYDLYSGDDAKKKPAVALFSALLQISPEDVEELLAKEKATSLSMYISAKNVSDIPLHIMGLSFDGTLPEKNSAEQLTEFLLRKQVRFQNFFQVKIGNVFEKRSAEIISAKVKGNSNAYVNIFKDMSIKAKQFLDGQDKSDSFHKGFYQCYKHSNANKQDKTFREAKVVARLAIERWEKYENGFDSKSIVNASSRLPVLECMDDYRRTLLLYDAIMAVTKHPKLETKDDAVRMNWNGGREFVLIIPKSDVDQSPELSLTAVLGTAGDNGKLNKKLLEPYTIDISLQKQRGTISLYGLQSNKDKYYFFTIPTAQIHNELLRIENVIKTKASS